MPFLEILGQMTNIKGQWPHFQYQLRDPLEAYLVQIWWFLLKSNVIAWTSQISSNSESKWPKWPLRSWLMTPLINTIQEYPMVHVWCKFSDSSPNLWWVIMQTRQISYNSELKWPKWPWRSMSMSPIFNSSWKYPMVHVWHKFGDSSSNLWRVIM